MFSKNTILFIGLAALSAARAQEFDNNDVPQQCRSVCQAMVDAARTCDQNFDGDRQEVDCICNTEGASTALPECAACVRQFDPDTDDDGDDNDENDVDEVVRSCGFSSTTFNPSSTASASSTGSGSGSITSSASRSLITSTYVTTSTDIDDDSDDDDDDNETRTLTRTTVFAADATPTDNAGGSASSAGQSGSSAVGGAVDSATSGAADAANSASSAAGDTASSATSDSGAVATGLPILGAGAGALFAALGLL
ncbi:hypothetical protein Q7P37_004954 [Cladosporium fusiforme]